MTQETKKNISKKLCSRYTDLSALQCREMLVLRGQRSLTVYGCRRILFYSPCEICLRVGKKSLSIVGEGLFCACFSAGSITVEGRITGISYCQAASADSSCKG